MWQNKRELCDRHIMGLFVRDWEMLLPLKFINHILSFKVVGGAEILPRDFPGNYYLSLTTAKILRLKIFTIKNFVNF